MLDSTTCGCWSCASAAHKVRLGQSFGSLDHFCGECISTLFKVLLELSLLGRTAHSLYCALRYPLSQGLDELVKGIAIEACTEVARALKQPHPRSRDVLWERFMLGSVFLQPSICICLSRQLWSMEPLKAHPVACDYRAGRELIYYANVNMVGAATHVVLAREE